MALGIGLAAPAVAAAGPADDTTAGGASVGAAGAGTETKNADTSATGSFDGRSSETGDSEDDAD